MNAAQNEIIESVLNDNRDQAYTQYKNLCIWDRDQFNAILINSRPTELKTKTLHALFFKMHNELF